MIILLAKRYIYRCRVEDKNLSIYVFKEWIKVIENLRELYLLEMVS